MRGGESTVISTVKLNVVDLHIAIAMIRHTEQAATIWLAPAV